MTIEKKTKFLVYILNCINGHYYTGYTNNLAKRYDDHLKGKASKYTRSFKPISIAQCWHIPGDKSAAMKIESFIKKLSKIKKSELVMRPELLMNKFNCIPFNLDELAVINNSSQRSKYTAS